MMLILRFCGSIESEIKNRCFVFAVCLENQPRWRRLQTMNIVDELYYYLSEFQNEVSLVKEVARLI